MTDTPKTADEIAARMQKQMTHQIETTSEHIARDIRDGIFPERSSRKLISVPLETTKPQRDRLRELASEGSLMDDYDRSVLELLKDFDAVWSALNSTGGGG